MQIFLDFTRVGHHNKYNGFVWLAKRNTHYLRLCAAPKLCRSSSWPPFVKFVCFRCSYVVALAFAIFYARAIMRISYLTNELLKMRSIRINVWLHGVVGERLPRRLIRLYFNWIHLNWTFVSYWTCGYQRYATHCWQSQLPAILRLKK